MLLFVYGSLLRGLHNHRCLNVGQPNGAKFIKTAQINGRLFSNNAYPFLVLSNHEGALVKGEIYEVESLENCDRLESYEENRHESENLFNRRKVQTVAEPTTLSVYVYEGGQRFLNNMKQFEQVPNGDWKTFVSKEMVQIAQVQDVLWDDLENDLAEQNASDRTKRIIRKIFCNPNFTARQMDLAFQRHVTKVEFIQCIKDFIKVINNG